MTESVTTEAVYKIWNISEQRFEPDSPEMCEKAAWAVAFVLGSQGVSDVASVEPVCPRHGDEHREQDCAQA